MKPILYDYSDVIVDGIGIVPVHNGIGCLADCISAQTKTSGDGENEITLELDYPVGGILWQEIKVGRVLKVKASESDTANQQLYIINEVERQKDKIIVKAEHISYLLASEVIRNFTFQELQEYGGGLQGVVTIMPEKILSGLGSDNRTVFNFVNNVTDGTITRSNAWLQEPLPVRQFMLGKDFGSYAPAFWEFDNFTCAITLGLDRDNGARLAYGSNITDISHNRTSDDVYTAVYPYKKDTDENGIVTITDIQSGNKVVQKMPDLLGGFSKVYPFEVTEFMQLSGYGLVTDGVLRSAASWIWKWEIGKDTLPETIDIDYVNLYHSGEFENIPKSPICLNDIVEVRYAPFGIDVKKRVSSVTYDVLLERNISVTLGDIPKNLVDKIYKISKSKRGFRA